MIVREPLNVYICLLYTLCRYFWQGLQGIQGTLAAMENRGLLDHQVPLVPLVDQGKSVQVWFLHARFAASSSTPGALHSS